MRPLLLVALALSVAAVDGQQTKVPGAFTSRITLVPVDVRVLDSKGRPVTDLKREEFQIFEDGRAQEIGAFEHIVFATEPAVASNEADAGPALRRAVGPDIPPPSGRVFLFMLGRGRLQHPTRVLDALIEFLDTRMLPQDHAAVIAYNRATDFTRDHAKLKAVVHAFRQKHERLEQRMSARQSGLAAAFGNKEVPPELQADVDAIFKTDGAPGFREMPPARATDAARIEQEMRDVGNLLQPVGVNMPVSGMAAGSPADLASLDEYMEGSLKTLQDLGGLLAASSTCAISTAKSILSMSAKADCGCRAVNTTKASPPSPAMRASRSTSFTPAAPAASWCAAHRAPTGARHGRWPDSGCWPIARAAAPPSS